MSETVDSWIEVLVVNSAVSALVILVCSVFIWRYLSRKIDGEFETKLESLLQKHRLDLQTKDQEHDREMKALGRQHDRDLKTHEVRFNLLQTRRLERLEKLHRALLQVPDCLQTLRDKQYNESDLEALKEPLKTVQDAIMEFELAEEEARLYLPRSLAGELDSFRKTLFEAFNGIMAVARYEKRAESDTRWQEHANRTETKLDKLLDITGGRDRGTVAELVAKLEDRFREIHGVEDDG